MKKILLMLLISSPIMGQETIDKIKIQPYFQRTEQKSFVSVLGVVSPVFLFNYDDQLQPIEGSGGLNLELFGRITSANVFLAVKFRGVAPFYGIYGNKILTQLDYIISSGLGWYAFDKRNDLGKGSFMTMDFNFFFYPFTRLSILGVSLDTRYSYSLDELIALTVGLDLKYSIMHQDNVFHAFSIGFAFGVTFNTK